MIDSFILASGPSSDTWAKIDELSDSLLSAGVGANMFEEEIDAVLFQTNNFLADTSFTTGSGPFATILLSCLILGAVFAIIYGATLAYKMMYKGEPFDPLKLLKVVAVAFVMTTWYAPGGILDFLAVVPNCIGSWTKTLYDVEVGHVEEKFKDLTPLLVKKDYLIALNAGSADGASKIINSGNTTDDLNTIDAEKTSKAGEEAAQNDKLGTVAGIVCLIDKIFFLIGIASYRIGFWGTIFAQQIALGMLTIFGPIQWAFSLLPKWEGAWAKWIGRYLTVHFYGAMLYFVGFYVLLMYDIVFSIQIDQINWILADDGANAAAYMKLAFSTSIYMLVAGVVSIECLNLVPDLAAWMIPEGDTAFSTRSFGSGVTKSVRSSARIG